MSRYIITILLLGLHIVLLGQETIIAIEFDGNDNVSIASAPFNCDDNPGTFGIDDGAFVINNVEGLNCCGCPFSGGLPECGDNTSFASIIGIPPLDLYCNISVVADVRALGDLECPNVPSGDPTGICDNSGIDALRIIVRLDGQVFELGSFCGDNQIGTFRLDNLTPDNGLLVIEIIGGTQEIDEEYRIENITISGTLVSFVPFDIISPEPTVELCENEDVLVLNAIGGSPSATYTWSLDGNIQPETTELLQRSPVTLADAGTYSVTISDPGEQCSESVVTEFVSVINCADPIAMFNGLATNFCYDQDQLDLPTIDNNGVPGTWNVPNDLVLADMPPFTELIFTPDPASGVTPVTIPITLDFIGSMGTFPSDRLEICVFDEPGQTINFIDLFNLNLNDIDAVSAFGFNYSAFSDDLATILGAVDVTRIDPGPYTLTFESIFFRSCGQDIQMPEILLNKVDRVSDALFMHCEDDTDPIDFDAMIGVGLPTGTWVDMSSSGVDLSRTDQVDVSLLVAGTYLFEYTSGGGANCSLAETSATFTLEVLPGASVNMGIFSPDNLCTGSGQSFDIGGRTFDEDSPSGDVTLVGLAANGCDSLVQVDLVFVEAKNTEISEPELCSGSGFMVEVNGRIFDETDPTGSETLVAANGCDSIVLVDLVFQAAPERIIRPDDLCQGDGFSITVNNIVFDEDNPTGSPIVPPAGGEGCDTNYTIDLDFRPIGRRVISPVGICSGSGFSIAVGGITFNQSNPSDEVMIPGPAGACDSIITVDLIFLEGATNLVEFNGCTGDDFSMMIGGTLYDEDNPEGTEVLTASNGCDSTVTIAFVYNPIDFQ